MSRKRDSDEDAEKNPKDETGISLFIQDFFIRDFLSIVFGIVYGLLAFVGGAFVPSVGGKHKRFVKIYMAIACILTTLQTLSQVGYQIYVFVGDKKNSTTECNSTAERIIRQFGVSSRPLIELWVFIIAGLWLVISNTKKDKHKLTEEKRIEVLRQKGIVHYIVLLFDVWVLILLLIAGCIDPSLLHLPYLVIAFGLVLRVAVGSTSTGYLLRMFNCILFYTCVHLSLIYLYQMPYSRKLLPADQLAARLLGLRPLLEIGCDQTSKEREVIQWSWALSEKWWTYLSPMALLTLILNLMTKLRYRLLFHIEYMRFDETHNKKEALSLEERVEEARRMLAIQEEQCRLSGSYTAIPMSPKKTDESVKFDTLLQSPPATRAATRKAAGVDKPSVSHIDDDEDPPSVDSHLTLDDTIKQEDSTSLKGSLKGGAKGEGMMFQVMARLNKWMHGVFNSFLIFSSAHNYIVSLISMMVWVTVYQNWMSLAWLLFVIGVWVAPSFSARTLCKITSPLTSFYASLLLVMQYIFALDLNPDEIISEKDGSAAAIGFTRPDSVPMYPVIAKAVLSIPIILMLRMLFVKPQLRAQKDSLPVIVRQRQMMEWPAKYGIYLLILVLLINIVLCPTWSCNVTDIYLYRIVYLIFFSLIATLMMISVRLLTKALKLILELLLVFISVTLIMVYMYQMPNMPEKWRSMTGMNDSLSVDLGLQIYKTTDIAWNFAFQVLLFVLNAVFIKVLLRKFIQIVLNETKGKRKGSENFIAVLKTKLKRRSLMTKIGRLQAIKTRCFEFVWRLCELHMEKVVPMALFSIAINDVSLFNGLLALLSVYMVLRPDSLHISGVIASVYLTVIATFKQALRLRTVHSYVEANVHEYGKHDCQIHDSPEEHVTGIDHNMSALTYVGLFTKEFTVKPEIGGILVLCFYFIVHHRQQFHYKRLANRFLKLPPGCLFADGLRDKAEKGWADMIKFMCNYGFYKFGVQITEVLMSLLCVHNNDAVSILHLVFLFFMFILSRKLLPTLWTTYFYFSGVLLVLQYMSCIGLPPFSCTAYPWHKFTMGCDSNKIGIIVKYLHLPDYDFSPDSHSLIFSFTLLIIVACQRRAFVNEKDNVYIVRAGDNLELESRSQILRFGDCPTHYVKMNPALGAFVLYVVGHSHWIVFIVIFYVGLSGNSLFCLVYLIAILLFIWKGHTVFLKSLHYINSMWRILGLLAIITMFLKNLAQVGGCGYINVNTKQDCWLIKLMTVGCRFTQFTAAHHYDALAMCMQHTETQSRATKAEYSKVNLSIWWDPIIFIMVLLQMRICNSWYFQTYRLDMFLFRRLQRRGRRVLEDQIKRRTFEDAYSTQFELTLLYDRVDELKAKESLADRAVSHADVLRSGDMSYYNANLDAEDVEEEVYNLWEQPEKKDSDRQGRYGEDDDDLEREEADKAKKKQLEEKKLAAEGDQQPKSWLQTIMSLLILVYGFVRAGAIAVAQYFESIAFDFSFADYILKMEKKELRQAFAKELDNLLVAESLLGISTVEYRRFAETPLNIFVIKEPEDINKYRKRFRNEMDKNAWSRLFIGLWRMCMSLFDRICYLLMVISMVANAGFLAFFFMFLVFGWGAFYSPRAPKRYWVVCIAYVEILIMTKFMFRLPIKLWHDEAHEQDHLWPPRFMGLLGLNNGYWDMVSLIALCFQRQILKRTGTWTNDADAKQMP